MTETEMTARNHPEIADSSKSGNCMEMSNGSEKGKEYEYTIVNITSRKVVSEVMMLPSGSIIRLGHELWNLVIISDDGVCVVKRPI